MDDFDVASSVLREAGCVAESTGHDDFWRLMTVVAGFLYHPVLDIVTGNAVTYNSISPKFQTYLEHLQSFQPLKKQLTELSKWKEPTWSAFSRVGCTGCSVDYDSAMLTRSQNFVENAASDVILKDCSISSLPKITSKVSKK